MPILKSIVDKLFRKEIKKQVFENEHLMYDYDRINLLRSQTLHRVCNCCLYCLEAYCYQCDCDS